jgi:hypothetical protein
VSCVGNGALDRPGVDMIDDDISALDNPWEAFAAKYPVGTEVEGDAVELHAMGGEADAAIAVPGVADADGRKEDRQRGRRHDVLEGQPRGNAPPLRPLPGLDSSSLHPDHGLTRRVARGAERDGAERPTPQVVVDPGHLTRLPEGVAEQVPQRTRVDQAAHPRFADPRTRELQSPPSHVADQLARVDLEHALR